MKIKVVYSALLLSAPAFAGGNYHAPTKHNPLQPSYYTENKNTNTNHNDSRSSSVANGGNANSTAHGGNSSASGGAGGHGGAGGAGGNGGSGGNVSISGVLGGGGGLGGSGGSGGSATGGSVGDMDISPSLSLSNKFEARRIPVNTAYAPNLTSSGEDTCLGSVSGGAQHAVFGLSFGKTTIDDNCVRLKRSKMLASLGEREAALAYWCDQPDMVQALSLAGVRCDGFAVARAERLTLMAAQAVSLAKPEVRSVAVAPNVSAVSVAPVAKRSSGERWVCKKVAAKPKSDRACRD